MINNTNLSTYTTSKSTNDVEWRSDIQEVLNTFNTGVGGVVQISQKVTDTNELDKLDVSISVGGNPKMVSLVHDTKATVLFEVRFDNLEKFIDQLRTYIVTERNLVLSNIVFLTF